LIINSLINFFVCRNNQSQPKVQIESYQAVLSAQPVVSAQQQALSSQPSGSSSNVTVFKKSGWLAKEFENYLRNPRTPPFDIKKLKTCSDADRKLCADKFFKFALNEPTKARELAQVARSILTLNMINQKTFINFLTECCEEKLKKYQKHNDNVDWVEMEALGILLGELYNVEVIKIFLMNIWLNNTKLMADQNDLALKMLFKVVQIIHTKMQTKDTKTLVTFMKYFEEYKNASRVPAAYVNWLESFLRIQVANLLQRDRSRSLSAVSTSSQISQASSLQSEPSSSSTGAIRKQT
jgi:hypothetical protein